MSRLFRCTQCLLSDREDFMKPPQSFGVYGANLILPELVARGAWTRCLRCREIAAQCRQQAGFPRRAVDAQPPTIITGSVMTCTECGVTRPEDHFDVSAMTHMLRNRKCTCIVCKGHLEMSSLRRMDGEAGFSCGAGPMQRMSARTVHDLRQMVATAQLLDERSGSPFQQHTKRCVRELLAEGCTSQERSVPSAQDTILLEVWPRHRPHEFPFCFGGAAAHMRSMREDALRRLSA